MDIKVSSVDPKYVTAIDKKAEELSKRAGKNFSRNEYIKMLIERDAVSMHEDIKQDKFDLALEDVTNALKRQTASLQKFIDTNSKIALELMKQLDIDFSELAEVIDDDEI